MKSFSTTLLISTYNWPAAVNLVLKAISEQTRMPDEVVIADDGSGKETAEVIDSYRNIIPVPIKYVWHPDEGYRKTIIMNKAVAQAAGDYIVQIDGDVLMDGHFIEDHLEFVKENCFVAGARVMLNEEKTKKIMKTGDIHVSVFQRGTKNFLNGIRSGLLRRWVAKRYKMNRENIYYIKGCNTAFWRSDFIRVNGYNEAITGWGPDDSELALRLYNAGVEKRYLKFGAIVYHLWHKEFSRERTERNRELMRHTLDANLKWCDEGIDKYLGKDDR
ncbi:MAG TPA: glycosyltransferase family 2 protein [Puia sp.]|nr:glycosyltransferase family 2 protein [Puia sp.]